MKNSLYYVQTTPERTFSFSGLFFRNETELVSLAHISAFAAGQASDVHELEHNLKVGRLSIIREELMSRYRGDISSGYIFAPFTALRALADSKNCVSERTLNVSHTLGIELFCFDSENDMLVKIGTSEKFDLDYVTRIGEGICNFSPLICIRLPEKNSELHRLLKTGLPLFSYEGELAGLIHTIVNGFLQIVPIDAILDAHQLSVVGYEDVEALDFLLTNLEPANDSKSGPRYSSNSMLGNILAAE